MWEDLGYSNDRKIITVGNVKTTSSICPNPGSSENYNRLKNKPRINGITLEGNKTSEELGLGSNFVYEQVDLSAEWIIEHNLEKYPIVSIIDDNGDEVEADIHYDSLNQITINFNKEVKGFAILG